MGQNNSPKKNRRDAIHQKFDQAVKLFSRWFFMLSLLLATVFCIFVWYRYVWKADWSDEKKQQYINEQAKFSFNKNNYQKMVDKLSAKKYKFENFPAFSGKDVFFPEGW